MILRSTSAQLNTCAHYTIKTNKSLKNVASCNNVAPDSLVFLRRSMMEIQTIFYFLILFFSLTFF